MQGTRVVVTRVHPHARVESVINLGPTCKHWTSQGRIELLHYQFDLITVSVRAKEGFRIMTFDASPKTVENSRGVMTIILDKERRVVVRNSSTRLVIGKKDQDSDKYWTFRSIAIRSALENSDERVVCRCENIGNYRIGADIAMEVIKDRFWIITNEIVADRESSDPISYYGGLCYDLEMCNP